MGAYVRMADVSMGSMSSQAMLGFLGRREGLDREGLDRPASVAFSSLSRLGVVFRRFSVPHEEKGVVGEATDAVNTRPAASLGAAD
jgi:hypothetical protein